MAIIILLRGGGGKAVSAHMHGLSTSAKLHKLDKISSSFSTSGWGQFNNTKQVIISYVYQFV